MPSSCSQIVRLGNVPHYAVTLFEHAHFNCLGVVNKFNCCLNSNVAEFRPLITESLMKSYSLGWLVSPCWLLSTTWGLPSNTAIVLIWGSTWLLFPYGTWNMHCLHLPWCWRSLLALPESALGYLPIHAKAFLTSYRSSMSDQDHVWRQYIACQHWLKAP